MIIFLLCVTCDFEQALMNAVAGIFPFLKIIGCFFHWKQAFCRKLASLKMKNENEIIYRAMVKYSMDILTVIPVNEMYSVCQR